MTLRLLAAAALLAIAAPAAAAETRSAAPGASPPSATIADAAWLEGAWYGEGLGMAVTEVYSRPAAGQIAGHYHGVKDGKVAFYELIQLVERGGSLAYRLKHFDAALGGWEEKGADAAEEFVLVAREDGALFFDGLTIRRTAPDAMDVWVRIENRRSGTTREERFRYKRER